MFNTSLSFQGFQTSTNQTTLNQNISFPYRISFCASAQWSKKLEVQLTVQIFDLGKTIGLSDSDAADFTICVNVATSESIKNAADCLR